MTNEDINAAIAEACNKVTVDSWGEKYPIPDYCSDLNAMHEAEKVIGELCKEGNYWFFVRELIGFPDAECDWSSTDYFAAVHATARQRAEAFLRTIGKWEEGTPIQ